jgi:protein-tyrosine phosphatase
VSDGYSYPFGDDGRIRGHWKRDSACGVVPTWTQIDETLYLGGQPVHGLPPDVDLVVNCDHVRFYEVPAGVAYLHLPFADGPLVEPDQLWAVARLIDRLRTAGQCVYLHCRFGLNRSGLLAALCLVAAGSSAGAAVELLREARDERVLCNPAFAAYVHSLDADNDASNGVMRIPSTFPFLYRRVPERSSHGSVKALLHSSDV